MSIQLNMVPLVTKLVHEDYLMICSYVINVKDHSVFSLDLHLWRI